MTPQFKWPGPTSPVNSSQNFLMLVNIFTFKSSSHLNINEVKQNPLFNPNLFSSVFCPSKLHHYPNND